jgi:hypothetical protein
MESFTEKKIEDVYQVALKLGLDKAQDIEKAIFRQALNSIAVAAVDEARHKIEQIMHDESNKYVRLK